MDAGGAVLSIQSATVDLPESELEMLWSASSLERLARSYWSYLTRITVGLIRVIYTPTGRDVVLLFRPFRLLTFSTPDYQLADDGGSVTWRIAGGILVSRPNEGQLKITVQRIDSKVAGQSEQHAAVRVDVEVRNFYPAIAARISNHLYSWTQSKIHVLVTYGFLRHLAKGKLAESVTGRFAEQGTTEPKS